MRDPLPGEEIPDWQAKHEAVRREIFEEVIRGRGNIFGEHGIGLAKRDYLSNYIGEANVELMRSIKRPLDPKGILNPGEIFSV